MGVGKNVKFSYDTTSIPSFVEACKHAFTRYSHKWIVYPTQSLAMCVNKGVSKNAFVESVRKTKGPDLPTVYC